VAPFIAWFSSACVGVFVRVVIFAFSSAADINREGDVVWVCGSVVVVACIWKGPPLPLSGARKSPFSLPFSFLCTNDARTACLLSLFLVSVLSSSGSELCKVSDFTALGIK
jgi:hypothetical protein